ncbi:MAG TPA: DEAD/DEAH box helicase [Bradyrhizobium sp.]|nr:DEAD/DEAH box helicase [Bradyrhizobium sp.]
MTISLREYQADGVAKIRYAMKHERRVVYQLSTGGGKTRIFSHIAEAAARKDWPVMMLAHRRQIVSQIASTLAGFDLNPGLILPDHSLTSGLLQVGMIETTRRRLEKLRKPRLLIVDEAHHSVCNGYRQIMQWASDAYILMVTATPARLDGKGMEEVADVLITGPEMRWLIEGRFLADYDYYAPGTLADFKGVHKVAGDLNSRENQAAVDKPVITGSAIDHWFEHLAHKPTIVFCVNVEHCEHVAAQFRDAGVKAYSIDGSMPLARQAALIKGLGTGDVEVLTSCQLISEGVDVPAVQGIILLQRTESLVRYLQNIGRALRLKSDGSKAIILDHVDCLDIHGAPCMQRSWSLAGKPQKIELPEPTRCRLCGKNFWTGSNPSKDCSYGPLCAYASGMPVMPQELPEVVAGKLNKQDISWARGWDLAAPGRYNVAQLEAAAAGDLTKLKQIAKAQGWSTRWANHARNRWLVANGQAEEPTPWQKFKSDKPGIAA